MARTQGGWTVQMDRLGRVALFPGTTERRGYTLLGWTAGNRRDGMNLLEWITAERERRRLIEEGTVETPEAVPTASWLSFPTTGR